MSLEEIRNILYEILTADDDNRQDNLDPMIRADQTMGVSLSSAVTKNGGVKIFQLQNITQQKVIVHVVRALRVIDALPPPPLPVDVIEIKELPEPKEVKKTLEEEIEESLDNNLTYSSFLNMIGKQFILAATVRHKTHKETAAAIKVSYSKLMQVKRSIS